MPTQVEIRYALYASLFGPLGFFLAALVSNFMAEVRTHSRSFLQELESFLFLWALGIVPSIAITLIIGIPFYAGLKYIGAHNPLIVAISGAPVMWLVTLLFPESSYADLFISAAAAVSLVFGILLWANKGQS